MKFKLTIDLTYGEQAYGDICNAITNCLKPVPDLLMKSYPEVGDVGKIMVEGKRIGFWQVVKS